MRIWTQEQRERQAEAIRKWKPWERSTGPNTDEGKAIAARNALKHGMRTAGWAAELKHLNGLINGLKVSYESNTKETAAPQKQAIRKS